MNAYGWYETVSLVDDAYGLGLLLWKDHDKYIQKLKYECSVYFRNINERYGSERKSGIYPSTLTLFWTLSLQARAVWLRPADQPCMELYNIIIQIVKWPN